MTEPLGYSQPVARHIENRLGNRVETPDELLRDVCKALQRNHGMAAYDYEERYIHIHHPTRLCSGCDSVERLQVVINTDTDVRTVHCPACDTVVRDSHIGPEYREIMLPTWRRLDLPIVLCADGGGGPE